MTGAAVLGFYPLKQERFLQVWSFSGYVMVKHSAWVIEESFNTVCLRANKDEGEADWKVISSRYLIINQSFEQTTVLEWWWWNCKRLQKLLKCILTEGFIQFNICWKAKSWNFQRTPGDYQRYSGHQSNIQYLQYLMSLRDSKVKIYAAQIWKRHFTGEILEGYDGWVESVLRSSDSGTVYNCFDRTTSISGKK